jgi:hypothetical protein
MPRQPIARNIEARIVTNAIRAGLAIASEGLIGFTSARAERDYVAPGKRLDLLAYIAEDGRDNATEEQEGHNRNDCD